MASEIKLTLNPVMENPTPEAAAEAQAVAEQVQADAAQNETFTPEEQQMID